MKQLKTIIYLLVSTSVLFTGCLKCDDETICCPAFEPEFEKLLLYDKGEVIVFENMQKEQVIFRAIEKHTTDAYVEECNCECRCKMEGLVDLTCVNCGDEEYNSSIDVYRNAQIYEGRSLLADYRMRLTFMNYARNAGDLNPETSSKYREQIELNGTLFENVFVYERDTNNIHPDSYTANKYLIWKFYYRLREGFVGFHDLKSGEVYTLNR